MTRIVLLFVIASLFMLFAMACVLRDSARRERESYRAYLDRLEEMARGR